MTPEALAVLHPRLYHATEPGAHRSIRRHGLLSARAILDRLDIEGDERVRLLERRRPAAVRLSSAERGQFMLNDNLPLTEKAFQRCLDDGLTPADWLRCLNRAGVPLAVDGAPRAPARRADEPRPAA